jgi:hypothetical protein
MAVVNLQNGSSLDGERLGNPAYRGNRLSTSWAEEGLAAKLMLSLIEKERARPRSILIEPKLVIRDSSNRAGLFNRSSVKHDTRKPTKRVARR